MENLRPMDRFITDKLKTTPEEIASGVVSLFLLRKASREKI
jgi:hypothetical protein